MTTIYGTGGTSSLVTFSYPIQGRSTRIPRAGAVKKRVPIVSGSSSDPLLLRVARGEQADRPPVWLMRQAGRYMSEFREYSNKYGFRHRSETPDIAIELSLQPWRAFKPDGVIMFSDILTPLPAIGVEFDVVKVRLFRYSKPFEVHSSPFNCRVTLGSRCFLVITQLSFFENSLLLTQT